MPTGSHWRFVSDGVMGGVSTGQLTILHEDGQTFVQMTGRVSTANNGGFIQMRLDLPEPPGDGTIGVRLIVRGNGQRYFVHLRTNGSALPWHYFRAPFDVMADWHEVRIPLERFTASGGLLKGFPQPGSLRSVAVVAFGRDHEARIDVRKLAFY